MAKLYNLEETSSDHSPIFLEPKVASTRLFRKQFCFENFWLAEPMCMIVKETWNEHNMTHIMEKVQVCGERLEQWGKEVMGKFGKRIRLCKTELKLLRNRRDDVSISRYKAVKNELFNIFNQQETFWRQRSKQLWLQADDQNNKYFHATASARRRSNHIHKLKNERCEWVTWDDGLQEFIVGYFRELFSSDNTNCSEIVGCIPTTITDQQNEELLKPVTNMEVKNALFQMHPDKSPGLDGMTPAFYQKHWSVVG